MQRVCHLLRPAPCLRRVQQTGMCNLVVLRTLILPCLMDLSKSTSPIVIPWKLTVLRKAGLKHVGQVSAVQLGQCAL